MTLSEHKANVLMRQERRAKAESRWNDPEMQRRDAERRAMYANTETAGKIAGWTKRIAELRAELDQLEKSRVTKETELRSLVAQLAELTGEAPNVAETDAEAEGEGLDEQPVEVARGRGRPRKVPA